MRPVPADRAKNTSIATASTTERQADGARRLDNGTCMSVKGAPREDAGPGGGRLLGCRRGAVVKILGIVAETHDSGVALLQDGTPLFVLEEERLNRSKRTGKFTKLGLAALTAELGLDIADVDVITTPWDVARLRTTALALLAGRFPLSLCLHLPGAHAAQRNEIML